MFNFLITLFFAWILAEVITGMFHWWEDRYGNENWPIVGKHIIKPNIEHHKHPSAMCKQSYWSRNYQIIIPTFIFAVIFFYFEVWVMFYACLLMSHMNEIHSWSHQKCGRIIKFLQKIGMLQSPRQHWIHHQRPYDKYYCVMTNYLNPILAWIRFWDFLELLVWLILGVLPRVERKIF